MEIVLDQWVLLGTVNLDRDGRLVFPALPSGPGLYRFRLLDEGASVYVGETDDLPRRFGRYRNPGPSQRTNVRLNGRMRSHLAAGGSVTLEICGRAGLTLGSEHEALDLRRKSHRVLAEEEALAQARSGGMGQILNAGG